MARTREDIRGVRGNERRAFVAREESAFASFVEQDAAFFDSGEFLGSVFRPSDGLKSLPESEAVQLDRMLDTHGLERVLKTLRELLDSRVAHLDTLDSLENIETSDTSRAEADALEDLLGRLARSAHR